MSGLVDKEASHGPLSDHDSFPASRGERRHARRRHLVRAEARSESESVLELDVAGMPQDPAAASEGHTAEAGLSASRAF